jgi:hypothetical protein
MLNQVVIEGFIAGEQWKYNGDTLFRMACRRDPSRLQQSDSDGDGSDYLTVRVPARLFAGMPIAFDRSKVYRVHGYIKSRQYEEPLGTFLKRAKGPVSEVVEKLVERLLQEVTHNRVTTEVVAEQLVQTDWTAPAPLKSKRAHGNGKQQPAVEARAEGAPV